MTAHTCPEGVIADGVVIQCGRDGGHEGNHTATTEHGYAEWPRIEVEPLADWEIEYAHEQFEATRLTAWNDDADLVAAGYVLAPEGRYVDEAHGIDWAIIVWACPICSTRRAAPGPGQAPHCVLHGRMEPVRT